MALNYSAEQYDQEFSSKRMQMWEVPKAELSKRPNQKGNLKFISNEHGHLLPEVRRSNRNPFGDFVGTWDMPKTIPGPYQLVTVINNI